jgi:hypothetical protein
MKGISLKEKWRRYKASKKGGGKKKGGSRKGGRKKGPKRNYRSRVNKYTKKAQRVGSFITNGIKVATAFSPIMAAAQDAAWLGGAGFNLQDQISYFGREILRKYAGVNFDAAWNYDTFNAESLAEGWAPAGAALGFGYSQRLVNRYAPIRGILPSKKQGVLSWGTSVAAKGISLVPVIKAASEALRAGWGTKWAKFASEMTDMYTGVSLASTGGGSLYQGFYPEKMMIGYGTAGAGIGLKKITGMVTKGFKLQVPRM